jgi:predicted RNase H-like nuclease
MTCQKLLSAIIRDLPTRPLSHNHLDAIISAYTAVLHSNQRSRILGSDPEGTIVIPQNDGGLVSAEG